MSKKRENADEGEVFKPLLEESGEGKVIWKDGSENDVEFSIKFNQNGHTQGNLEYLNISDSGNLIKYLDEGHPFVFIGKDSHDEEFTAEHCFTTRQTQSWGESFSASAEIAINKLKYPDKPISEKSQGLSLRFWIVNMSKTFRVFIDTELGQLSIRHFKDMDRLESLMKNYQMPLLTSVIHLEIPKEKVTTVSETIKKAKTLVENFLKITRLSQTSWHSMVAIDAFDRNGDDKMPRVYFEILSAKTKVPHSLGLTNMAHASYFLNSAWKGYSEETDEKYGFTYALEWYVDSWGSSILETKFLCLTTAFELLLEKFHAYNDSEKLLSDEKFREFREKVKENFSNVLKDMDVNSETRSLMYNGISAMQRRSYLDKAKMLLDYWKIKYDDVGTTLEEIISVRNELTHRGRFKPEEEDSADELLRMYKGLFSIITRIFLVMLNYDGKYIEFGKWIEDIADIRTT